MTRMERLVRIVAIAAAALVAFAAQGAARSRLDGRSKRPQGLEVGMRPVMGDFDMMARRRLVRVLVPISKTFYYIERGRTRGVSAEIIEALQADLNQDAQDAEEPADPRGRASGAARRARVPARRRVRRRR
jgi:hypothetical protein